MTKILLPTAAACAAFIVPVLCPTLANAQVEWTVASGGNGHTYQAVSSLTGISWNTANAQAQAGGGYLATITSAAENAFIFNLIDAPQFWGVDTGGNSQGAYFGGVQANGSPEPGGGFSWVTGETWAFTAWTPGQPDNGGGVETVTQFFQFGIGRSPTWNDVETTSSIARAYVIERNAVAVPEAGTFALLGFALVPVTAGLVRRRK